MRRELTGRYRVLRPDDAELLVTYFLHPAGLLVEPAEGWVQFAHMSFQEYLCAVDLYERGKAVAADEGLAPFLRRELFKNLGRPGWDEVGMLVLCIHSEDTRQEGHLTLLSWLDPSDWPQASLYVSAVSGRELHFTSTERRERLPMAILCALLHPLEELGKVLGRVEDWSDHGLDWLIRLLEAPDGAGVPDLLRSPLVQLGLRHAAFETFDLQAEDPGLARRRGLRPSEPLPVELGLFDDQGRPLLTQNRSSFEALRRWLTDDDAILAFFFPEGLDDGTRADLLEQLEILHGQPWAPERFVDAVLADWPEGEEEMDISFEAGERRLLAALDELDGS